MAPVPSTTYDADSDITAVTTTNSGGTINAFSYVYDPAGNETSETDNGVTTTYTYDDAGQLTGANSTTYSYDADGNGANAGDTVGTDNELLSDGTYNYTYDSAGNEVSKTNIATGDVWTYYYNSQNAMTQALETTSPGTGGVMEQDIFYRYDAFGNMIQKEVVTGGMSGTDTITDYAVDGWNPALAGATGNSYFNTWAVLNVSGSSTSLQTRNLFGDQVDEIIARIDQAGASDSAGVYWDLTDKLGSVRTVLNGSGTVVDTINYDAYGNTTSETNAADQGMYGWTGQEKDLETGLQYNNARWYDSSTGRWISQDPLGFDAGDSNLYRYVNNAPTDATDPSGMVTIESINVTAVKDSGFGAVPELGAIVTSGRFGFGFKATVNAKNGDDIKDAKFIVQFIQNATYLEGNKAGDSLWTLSADGLDRKDVKKEIYDQHIKGAGSWETGNKSFDDIFWTQNLREDREFTAELKANRTTIKVGGKDLPIIRTINKGASIEWVDAPGRPVADSVPTAKYKSGEQYIAILIRAQGTNQANTLEAKFTVVMKATSDGTKWEIKELKTNPEDILTKGHTWKG